MKIGVTERGDAGCDLSWYEKLDSVDGAIIITKKLSDGVIERLLNVSKPVILHCTCTGLGGTWLEPNVYDYKTQLNQLIKLIDKGFDKNRVVLRIDPIIPTDFGIEAACNVIDYIEKNNIPIHRIRISIYDEYEHVKERLRKLGKEPFYKNSFFASKEEMAKVVEALSKYTYRFETCAEDLITSDKFKSVGCVSLKDISLMKLERPSNIELENMQKRTGCHCLSCKKELLTNKEQCPNACVYCYWKN